MKIIPAILAHTESELREKLVKVPRGAEEVHVDFTESSLISPLVKGEYPAVGLPVQAGGRRGFAAHLMLPHPEEYFERLAAAGFKKIIVQIEQIRTPSVLKHSVSAGEVVEIIPSLEIPTPLSVIDSFVNEIKEVQLMGIAEIGAQGRPFDARVVERVRALHQKYPHLKISVDGGVNKENAVRLEEAGASALVVGSAIGEFI